MQLIDNRRLRAGAYLAENVREGAKLDVASSQFSGRSFVDLHAWYFERMEALNAAQVTGVFSVGSGDPEKRRAALAEIHRIDGEIADLRRQAKAKLPLNDLVELNVSVKRLLRERDQWKGALT